MNTTFEIARELCNAGLTKNIFVWAAKLSISRNEGLMVFGREAKEVRGIFEPIKNYLCVYEKRLGGETECSVVIATNNEKQELVYLYEID